MINPLNFLSKFIKSSNQKELDRIQNIVSKINSLEQNVKDLKDSDFPIRTKELKEKINNGIISFLKNEVLIAEIKNIIVNAINVKLKCLKKKKY